VPIVLKSGNLNLLETLGSVMGLLYLYLSLGIISVRRRECKKELKYKIYLPNVVMSLLLMIMFFREVTLSINFLETTQELVILLGPENEKITIVRNVG
jgi:hypothetical protein